jgi:DNA polymerase V
MSVLSRPLPVADTLSLLPLSLMSSEVRAGFPSPADDFAESSLDLNELMIQHKEATFFCRVKGRSMEGAGIFEGDLLVIDRAITPRSGCIVVAAVDGELTVKRFMQRNGQVQLEAASAKFPPITFHDGQELQVWGVVTGSVRRFG